MTDERMTPPPAPPTRQGEIPRDADAPTSRMAIASLILGVLGFCTGITAIVGLILGVIGIRQIQRSNGKLRGQGVAVAGVAISAGALLIAFLAVVVLVGVTMPAVGIARQAATQARATAEARQIAQAMMQYHTSYRSEFPPVDAWRSALTTVDELDEQTDGDGGGKTVIPGGFSMNAALDGMHAYDVAEPGRTVMIFETPSGSPLSGGREVMAGEPLNADGFVIIFVDSTVELVPADQLDELIWDPAADE